MNMSSHEKTILQDKTTPSNEKKVIRCYRKTIMTTSWIITAIITAILFLSTSLFTCVLATSIMCLVTGLLNVFTHYIKTEHFPISAYILLIISYLIGFAKLILVPLSISLVMTKDVNFIENKDKAIERIDIGWSILYWTSIIMNYFIMPVVTSYWNQGHPTFKQRLYHTFAYITKLGVISLLVFNIIFLILVLKYGTDYGLGIISAIFQTINFVQTNFFLIVLLGFGLISIPFYFFAYTNTAAQLKLLIPNLPKFHEDFEIAVNTLIVDRTTLVETCSKITCESYPEKQNNKKMILYANSIIFEVSKFQLNYNNLVKYREVKGNITKIINEAREITVDILSEMYQTVKQDFYSARRKEASLLRLYDKVRRNSQLFKQKDTIELNQILDTEASLSDTLPGKEVNYISERNSVITNKSLNFFYTERENVVIPKEYSWTTYIVTKLISMIFIPCSLFVLFVQLNLYCIDQFNLLVKINEMISFNFYYSYLFVLAYCSFMFVCCLYALSRFRVFEIYILIPHHTDKFGMISNAGLCDTLILGICYNVIYLFSLVDSQAELKTTNILTFFATMYKILYMYKSYCYIFPTLLIIVALITIISRVRTFRWKMKGVEERYNHEDDLPEKKNLIDFNLINSIELTYYKSK